MKALVGALAAAALAASPIIAAGEPQGGGHMHSGGGHAGPHGFADRHGPPRGGIVGVAGRPGFRTSGGFRDFDHDGDRDFRFRHHDFDDFFFFDAGFGWPWWWWGWDWPGYWGPTYVPYGAYDDDLYGSPPPPYGPDGAQPPPKVCGDWIWDAGAGRYHWQSAACASDAPPPDGPPPGTQ